MQEKRGCKGIEKIALHKERARMQIGRSAMITAGRPNLPVDFVSADKAPQCDQYASYGGFQVDAAG